MTCVLPLALIMPVETVCWYPKGLPMAITQSPTCTSSESPNSAGKKFSPSILMTARSVFGSMPTILECLYCFTIVSNHSDFIFRKTTDNVVIGQDIATFIYNNT